MKTRLTVAEARRLPLPEGRKSARVLGQDDVDVRFYAPEGRDDQTPHDQDEFYVVASGSGKFRVEDEVVPCAPGDLLFVGARKQHRFEDFTPDFSVWVLFYGPRK